MTASIAARLAASCSIMRTGTGTMPLCARCDSAVSDERHRYVTNAISAGNTKCPRGHFVRHLIMAGTTRLELATSAVTGQRSNQLNYVPGSKTGFLVGSAGL